MRFDEEEIVWSKDYEVGVNEIDEQHQILVNTLNDANKILASDYSLESLENITKDLLSYALYHFETEEELMSKYDYKTYFLSDYETHINQHRNFSAEVASVRKSIKQGNLIEKSDLINFLVNWLINHINNTDKKLGVFLKEKIGT